MSASLWTECQIQCDHPGCSMSAFGGHYGGRDTTARTLRPLLKREGWRVNVRTSDAERLTGAPPRRDFCPVHAESAA